MDVDQNKTIGECTVEELLDAAVMRTTGFVAGVAVPDDNGKVSMMFYNDGNVMMCRGMADTVYDLAVDKSIALISGQLEQQLEEGDEEEDEDEDTK
jgi:hypothetical protein